MTETRTNAKRVIKKLEKSDGFNDFMEFFHSIDAAFWTFFKFIALIFGFTLDRKTNKNSENERKYHQCKADAFRACSVKKYSPFFAFFAKDNPVSFTKRQRLCLAF